MTELSLEDFLLARLDEMARSVDIELINETKRHELFSMVKAQREMIEWHRRFPVLVQTRPDFEFKPINDYDPRAPTAINEFSYSVSQKMDLWLRDEYHARMGHWPPAMGLLRVWVKQYRNHPDFNEEWLS